MSIPDFDYIFKIINFNNKEKNIPLGESPEKQCTKRIFYFHLLKS